MEANPSSSAKASGKAIVEPNEEEKEVDIDNIKDKSPVELREMMAAGSKESMKPGSEEGVNEEKSEKPEEKPEKSPEKPQKSPDKSPVKTPQRRPTLEKSPKIQRSPPLEKPKTKSGVAVEQSKPKMNADPSKKSPPKPDSSKIEISSKKSGSINEQPPLGNQDGVWCGSTESMAPMRPSNASAQILLQEMKYFTPGPRAAYLQVGNPNVGTPSQAAQFVNPNFATPSQPGQVNFATPSQAGQANFAQSIIDQQQRPSDPYRPMQPGYAQYPSNLQAPSGYVPNAQQPYPPNAQQSGLQVQQGGYPQNMQQAGYPSNIQQPGYPPNVQQGYPSNIQQPSPYPNAQQPYQSNMQGFPPNAQRPPSFPTNAAQPSAFNVAQQPAFWPDAPQEMNQQQFSYANMEAGARPDDEAQRNAPCSSSSRQPEGIQVVQYLPRFQASQKSQSFLQDIPNNAVLLVPVEDYRNWPQNAPVKQAREKSAQYQYPVDQQARPYMLDASTQQSKAYDTVPLETEMLRKDNRPIGAFAVKERSRENLTVCRGPTTTQYGRGAITNVASGYRTPNNFNSPGNFKYPNFNERNKLRNEPSRIQRPEKKDDFLDKYCQENIDKYTKDKEVPLAKATSSKPAWQAGPYNKSGGCGGGYSGSKPPVKSPTNPLAMKNPFPFQRQDFQGPCYDPISQRVIMNKAPEQANPRAMENERCPEVMLTCSEVEIALRTKSTRDNEKYVNSPQFQNSNYPPGSAKSSFNFDPRKYYGFYEDESDTREAKARKCSDKRNQNQPRSPATRGRRSRS